MRAANQERDSVRVSATPDHRRCCFLAAGEEVRAVPEEVEVTTEQMENLVSSLHRNVS